MSDELMIHAMLDGELSADAAHKLLRRIKAEPDLRHQYEIAQATKTALEKLPATTLTPSFIAKISQLDPKPEGEANRDNSWRMIAASVVLTALFSSGLTYVILSSATKFDPAAAIAAGHRRSLLAASPIDIASSDSHTVKPWFDSHLGLSPPVVDFAAQGFALVGGRVEVIDQRPVPSLVYRHNEHLISVVAVPLAIGESDEEKPKHLYAGGLQLIHLNQRGYAYWFVSDMEWAQLDSFVADFQVGSNNN